MEKRVVLYTDGSCLGNPGVGGFAARLIWGSTHKDICGSALDTTNNRMELQAVISGLEALTRPSNVLIVTDSVYVKSGVETWIANWIAKGWKTSSRKPVKNKDLWQRLMRAEGQHQTEWQWVKGHSNHPHNDAVDKLARDAALALERKAAQK